MQEKKEVIILTKSRKNHNYCVAGVEKSTGKWIRLVSNEYGRGIDKEIMDGNSINSLDTVIVEGEAKPLSHQPENFCIYKIAKTGTVELEDVLKIHPVDISEDIFLNKLATFNPQNADKLRNSLMLVKATNFTVKHESLLRYDKNGFPYRKDRVLASFRYNGNSYYDFYVTDEEFCEMQIPYLIETYLVISIPDSEFYDNKYYKFIAKIFLLY